MDFIYLHVKVNVRQQEVSHYHAALFEQLSSRDEIMIVFARLTPNIRTSVLFLNSFGISSS
jgi:hypothetical protein